MGFMLIEKLLIKSRYHRRMTNDNSWQTRFRIYLTISCSLKVMGQHLDDLKY